jgi:hypothetical protein
MSRLLASLAGLAILTFAGVRPASAADAVVASAPFEPALAELPDIAGASAERPAPKPLSPREQAVAVEFFEKKVRPLLASNCYTCHSANTNAHGGLRVDDRNGLLTGGNGGPAVVPGHPEKSRMVLAVSYGDKKLQMPPKKQLSEDDVAVLTKWIADGAAWPAVELPSDLGKSESYYADMRKDHWAWQPLKVVPPPAVRDAAWPRDDVDRFVLARLEKEGLAPVADADRVALIRRVTFDLTGLPPTPEEIDAFARDGSDEGLEKLVDRLLASPAFGERWGRHWLDVARYGESTGSSRNVPLPHAWRYRDYVLKAFNDDKPYDRFLIEQIAGDLLPAESQPQRDELAVATGFLALGVKDVNQRFKVRFVMDNIDEQIDTVSRAVLALTASCARCHDHKFDPIPARDYYALAGIFQSTDLCAGVRNKMGGGGLDYYDTQMLLLLGGESAKDPAALEKIEQAKKDLAEARRELAAIRDDPNKEGADKDHEEKLKAARQKVNKIQADLVNLTDPAMSGPVAFGVRDAKTIADAAIRVRGEAELIGPVVPRGFLSVLAYPGQPQAPTHQSGRLELAQWLASEKNPLTPRVMANRVWHHLFGQGLVATVDNFGSMGDAPSHPELLDHLAARFVRDGWSVKKLVRGLVLSRSYRLGTESSAACRAVDPANRLVWRHSPRRLEAEELRDAMLAAAGSLDLTRPEGSPAQSLKVVEMTNDGGEAKRLEGEARKSLKRSVYLPLVRGVTPTSLAVFDFAEQGMVTGSRDVTTVAPQALYLLNDPFVQQQARATAQRVLDLAGRGDAERVTAACVLTLGRAPTAREIERALAYLAEEEQSAGDHTAAWAGYCQALLGSAEFRYLR